MTDAADFSSGLTRVPKHVSDAAAAAATAAVVAAADAATAILIAAIADAQAIASTDLAAIKTAVDALDLAGAGATSGDIDDIDALVETAVLSSADVDAAIAAAS